MNVYLAVLLITAGWARAAVADDLLIYMAPDGDKLYSSTHIYRAHYIAMNHHHWEEISLEVASSSPFDQHIALYASDYGLDPALIKAVIHSESSFDPNALSPAGARGLMQLMPETAWHYGIDDFFDPQQNIRAGSLHLKYLMQRYDDNLDTVLAAYNAGEGNVARYGGVPPFEETTLFLERVKKLMARYRLMGITPVLRPGN